MYSYSPYELLVVRGAVLGLLAVLPFWLKSLLSCEFKPVPIWKLLICCLYSRAGKEISAMDNRMKEGYLDALNVNGLNEISSNVDNTSVAFVIYLLIYHCHLLVILD